MWDTTSLSVDVEPFLFSCLQSWTITVSVNLYLLPPMGKVVPPLLSKARSKCATTSENTCMKHSHSVSEAGPSLMVVPYQTQYGLFVLVNMLCSAALCSGGRLLIAILKQGVIYTFCNGNPFDFYQKLVSVKGKKSHRLSGRQKSFPFDWE